ncbi:hypothetical protein SASC598P14_013770 [Snodgrassella alvi SCGC AB-598-P14]|uniref:Uncharacterized protein n=1 Tax=Snodgrassella alvi SCGC AB-598-J21 TaxID=1385367 RepID=A0A074W2T8_9NEIS|nr:hypothetical protein SASC598J21_004810 [Snodgrassella alvi SCGC AB-598-J21]KES13898.1 hypothetical protein SASC598P14_013770 [Snodgrassella alvi SCGC AB-598-P14]
MIVDKLKYIYYIDRIKEILNFLKITDILYE